MLVLSRKIGESIVIGDNINITTLSVHGNQIRIGITAPREISVHRQEVFDRINKQTSTTGQSSDGKNNEKSDDSDSQ